MLRENLWLLDRGSRLLHIHCQHSYGEQLWGEDVQSGQRHFVEGSEAFDSQTPTLKSSMYVKKKKMKLKAVIHSHMALARWKM